MTCQSGYASAEFSAPEVCHVESAQSVMVLKTWAQACLDLEEVFIPRLRAERDQALALADRYKALHAQSEAQALRLLRDRDKLRGVVEVQADDLEALRADRDHWQAAAGDKVPVWMLWLTGSAAALLGVGGGVVAAKLLR